MIFNEYLHYIPFENQIFYYVKYLSRIKIYLLLLLIFIYLFIFIVYLFMVSISLFLTAMFIATTNNIHIFYKLQKNFFL